MSFAFFVLAIIVIVLAVAEAVAISADEHSLSAFFGKCYVIVTLVAAVLAIVEFFQRG